MTGLDDLLSRLRINAAISKQSDGRFRLALAKRLKKRLQKHFTKQQNFVLKEAAKLGFFKQQTNAIGKDDQKEIDALVAKIPEKEAVADTLTLFWQASMLKGGKTIVRQLKLGEMGISFSLQNKEAIRWLRNKKIIETAEPGSLTWSKAANELRLSNYKGNIHLTTKENIKRILVEAAESGASYQQTSKLIQAAGDSGVFSQARGELISVRELGCSYEEGKRQVIETFSEEFPDRQPEKKWQTVNDNRVTPTHTDNQKQGWIKHTETFSGTGDLVAPADSNPRCRCATIYRIPPPPKE